MEQRSAEIAGTQTTWLEAEPVAGAASTPLYVHGVPNSGAMWEPFLERTGGYAPDLPGFGSSDKSAGFDYSIPGYGRFLSEFVDHIGEQRIQLVMHDWGAVGLALAQERPELIDRLVILDAVPFLPDYRWHRIARIWRTPIVGELFMGSSTRWGNRRLLRQMKALPPEAIDPFVEETWKHFDHGTQRAILKLYRSAPSEVLERAGERLGRIRAPALVVWGDEDRYLPTRFAHDYADALGGDTRVEIVQGGGHWTWIGAPRVVDLVADFLL